ncbi:MAG: PIN domain-containing protein [Candidatus Asgardarchaeia archaeon]
MKKRIIIDTRFFVEYLFASDMIIKEKSLRLMNNLIKEKEGLVPSIVISELAKIICRYVGVADARSIIYSLVTKNFQIIAINDEIAFNAGILKCKHQNVPIGDCIISAIAKKLNAKILTDDPHFKEDLGIETIWI